MPNVIEIRTDAKSGFYLTAKNCELRNNQQDDELEVWIGEKCIRTLIPKRRGEGFVDMHVEVDAGAETITFSLSGAQSTSSQTITFDSASFTRINV